MALPSLAAEAEHAGDKLARRGYALIDGSDIDLRKAAAAFDTLGAGPEAPLPVAAKHPLAGLLLAQPAVRELVDEALGSDAALLRAVAYDLRTQFPVAWHQPGTADSAGRLILRWYLDLVGPADGGLRVLPGSHGKGRLTAEALAHLVVETPAVELAVSPGTVVALNPLLVQGTRRRTTRGPRRILQVELASRA